MNISEQRDKLFEVLERAGHNLNLEFFGSLFHNVRYKVDYHLINARVKYYSNSKNPRVIHTKLNNSHLVSLRTHPNEKYVVRTGDFLHLGPEDTINDILQYYQSSLRALAFEVDTQPCIFDQNYATVEEVDGCKVGKLISLSSGSEDNAAEKIEHFAGFDSNGDEQLESTPAGQDSSAICKGGSASNSTFQLTTASLRFDEHLRELSDVKRQSSLKILKREILSRFGGNSPESESSKKEKRKLSILRRKSTQQSPSSTVTQQSKEFKNEAPKFSPVVLAQDCNLIDLSEGSTEGKESHTAENDEISQTAKNVPVQLTLPSQKVKEKTNKNPGPKVFVSRDKRRKSEIRASSQVKKSFRVRGPNCPSKTSQRFYDKLAKKEKNSKPWNTVYNDISLSAARLSTGSEGTSREDYESLKSDLTSSRRKESDLFAENLRQGKAKFYSPTMVRIS